MVTGGAALAVDTHGGLALQRLRHCIPLSVFWPVSHFGVVAALNDWMPDKLTVIQTGVPNRLVWRLVREALMQRTVVDLAPPTAQLA